MKRATILLAFALFIPARLFAQADHETGEFVLTAPKGAKYTLIVPDTYDRKKGATLLFWLHGAGDNHANAARGIKSRRFKPDWILAIPDARTNGSWQMDEEDRVMDVLDQVQEAYNVRRCFIGGFSRGGFFTFGFGLKHTDRFAGYLCVGGGIPNPALAKKEQADRFAVAIVHGEVDNVVPFDSAKTAKAAFEKAGWKEKLFFRSVPGLAHRIDQAATQAALDWLDETAQVLKTPKDYYDYGMKLHAQGRMGRAYWALSEIPEEGNSREKWWKTAQKTLGKIQKEAEKQGKKLQRDIGKDRNAKWVPVWREYTKNFEGVPFHAEVKATFDECVTKQNEQADELWSAVDPDDPKTAIEACLDIREECYVADAGSVTKAKELLARYRDDAAIAKKYRRQLKGTEEWK
jgi:predicted esterase